MYVEALSTMDEQMGELNVFKVRNKIKDVSYRNQLNNLQNKSTDSSL